MKGEEEQVGRAVQALDRPLYNRFQAVDVGGVVVVGRHGAQGGHAAAAVEEEAAAPTKGGAVNAVVHRARGGTGELGEHRKEQNPVHTFPRKGLHRRVDAGVAVAHTENDAVAIAQPILQPPFLAARVNKEGGSLRRPDALVQTGRAPGPSGEDHQVEDGQPFQRVEVDDPGIGEELPQIGTEGGRGRRLRRAQLGD